MMNLIKSGVDFVRVAGLVLPSFILLGLLISSCSTQTKASHQAYKNDDIAKKTQSCVACHGADGRHGKDGVPPLGGRSYEELVEAMYKVRGAYSPQPLVGHQLSDEDIHEIATYFSRMN